jgi:LysR family nitrogen assimilation transcriptional regulator
MDLKQLRYFTVIAEAGSLSLASARLHIAQPALSLHLAKLESELGVQLMVRNNRGVTLTGHGERLLHHAGRILKDCDDTVSSFRCAATTPMGVVSVGFFSTTPEALVQLFIERVHAQFPQIFLKVYESHSGQLETDLQNGTLDFALVMVRKATEGFDIHPLLFEELFLVSPPEPGNTAEAIDFREVCDLPLFLPKVGISLRDQMDEAALNIGKTPNVVHEIDSARFRKRTVLSGLGHTILPWSTVVDDHAHKRFLLRRIVNPELRALLGLAESSARPPSRARQAVKSALVETITGLVNEGRWSALAYTKPKSKRTPAKES